MHKFGNELDLHKSGNELSLDLHKSGIELSLDLHKSGNDLSLDLYINELPKWNSSLLDFLSVVSHISWKGPRGCRHCKERVISIPLLCHNKCKVACCDR